MTLDEFDDLCQRWRDAVANAAMANLPLPRLPAVRATPEILWAAKRFAESVSLHGYMKFGHGFSFRSQLKGLSPEEQKQVLHRLVEENADRVIDGLVGTDEVRLMILVGALVPAIESRLVEKIAILRKAA